jgi:hypothetical protein
MNGAGAILKYLEQVKPNTAFSVPSINRLDVVNKQDVFTLIQTEKELAAQLGLESYKFKTNEEMLSAIH